MDVSAIHEEDFAVDVRLGAYGPYVEAIELSLDGNVWEEVEPGFHRIHVSRGRHTVRARALTSNGSVGPERQVTFELGLR